MSIWYLLTEAIGAVWALSFDEDNRKVMVENEELCVITTLLNLKTTDDAKIKAAANGALWNLRGDLEKSKKFHDLGMYLVEFECQAGQNFLGNQYRPGSSLVSLSQ